MSIYRKYFTQEQLQNLVDSEPNWGVSILNVGHNLHPAKKSYPDQNHPDSYYFNWEKGRRLDEFQLVYISGGGGVFESENLPPTIVEAGTAFLLFPNVWHRYKPAHNTGWEEFWVGFGGHYSEYLMRQECFSPESPLLKIGFDAELLAVFLRLVDTLKYEGLAHKQISSCLVIQLLGLIYASALMSKTVRTRKEKLIHQIRYEIHENWMIPISMEDLAAKHDVGYVWFRKAFKEITGTSPGQYHLNIKLDKASQMLRQTTLSVSEIAYQAGFESEFYFSRIFKKKMGNAPSQYRHSLL
ncbi:helix-turn-helix transcriptional regulator [Dyadobacter psychrotolerans]|uniref:AraC family transcriptional regulator n=1 Tax=Dyadobacter psychrotolerans TaxID=2541721 RepID=A0A4R5DTR1_9BACT|nr:AraC family transcriptional regulator [Dyadobacter psychrotolerans]TDE15481.1 AraC family transcriptional regulator [Dyadobacter psychrotolerans]